MSQVPEFSDTLRERIAEAARPQPNEAMVQDRLSALFKAFQRDVQLAQPIEGGEADIHLTDCNVIVECKDSGKAGPSRQGSDRKGQARKKQDRQLADYVEGMIRRQFGQIDLEGLGKRPWVGILTDGRKWWAWRWENGRTNLASPYMQFEAHPGEETAVYNRLKELLYNEDVAGMLRWVPEDMASMFKGEDVALERVYRARSGEATVSNKQEVWLELLKGSGMAPRGVYQQHWLFIRHTYLVVVARAVVGALTDDPGDDDPNKVLNEGFVSWVLESRDGRDWAQRMFQEAFRYDWRMRATDVLRRFYEHVIPKADRKVYGEYYTPDWVAEMLAERVLDEEWLKSAPRAALEHAAGKRRNLDGIGVLDPTCGSGTFLYHAARRILGSRALRGKSPKARANCTARLVHGLDIHPVAVEMTRATLLRALPVPPDGGASALSVAQGDSLLASGADGLFEEASFPNEGTRWFTLPREFLLREDYRQRTEALVESAKQGEQEVPRKVTAGLPRKVAACLEEAHKSLLKLCNERGNSVWTWLVVNAVAPLRLHARKVDRILANPPWVRMSDIQVPERKAELGQLARELDLWVGGKNATGFDIGGLFVRRCRELYRTSKQFAGAWVLNRASISGGNWKKFRDTYKQQAAGVVDFSEVRDPPFPGAKSCAWLERTDPAARTKQRQNFKQEILHMHPGIKEEPGVYKVRRTDPWPVASGKCTFGTPPAKVPKQPSGYLEDGKCRFRNGATLFPHGLIVVEDCKIKVRRAHFHTKASTKGAWAALGTQEGQVPKHWIVNTAFSRDLLPFCLRAETSRAILPLSRAGILESAPQEKEAYWEQVEQLYSEHRGRGGNTPKTLLERIDYSSALFTQLPLRKGQPILAYNASGQYLRAAACADNVIFEHGLYWLALRSRTEADYLAAVLNAPVLQEAFAQARLSDRHFDTHIWTDVPIPYYASRDPLHKELSALGARAAKVARKAQDACNPEDGQVKTSAFIRQELAEDGVSTDIDKAVRRLLPRQVDGGTR